MEMPLNYLRCSRSALWQNAEAIRDHVGVPVIGVVKCGGYGVSIGEAARAWQQAGCKMFAVSLPQEALELRRLGFREDILLMAPVPDQDILTELVRHKVLLTVTDLACAHFYLLWSDVRPLRVHAAVDTGMGRFGVRWEDMEQLKAIYQLKGLQIEGIFSHFPQAFDRDPAPTRRQLGRFLSVTEGLAQAGFSVGLRHIANSCAALRFPETRLDAVRVGSALVGKLCIPSPVPLQKVCVFRAQVVACKTLLPGDTTGYGGVCRVKKLTQAVVVAVGREDGLGYLEHPGAVTGIPGLKGLFRVLLGARKRPRAQYNGSTLPMVGRVGQQYTLFDATGLNIRPGEYVTLELPQLFPGRASCFRDLETVDSGQLTAEY